jgi:MFS transporter, PCFT/HCP family, solute carrier family 46, member 3
VIQTRLLLTFTCFNRIIGFYGIFSLSALSYVFALVYGIFYLDESNIEIDEYQRLKLAEKSFFADFFDSEHVMETLTVAFKKGENHRRLKVSMLLIVVMVVFGPMHGKYFYFVADHFLKQILFNQGEMSVMYLFTRYKFNWSEVQFSIFTTYAMFMALVGKNFNRFVLKKN